MGGNLILFNAFGSIISLLKIGIVWGSQQHLVRKVLIFQTRFNIPKP